MTFTFKHQFSAWTGLRHIYMTLVQYKGALFCCKGYW